MQLDKTYIAIRERDMLDIMDLSLQVIRFFFKPLIITFLVGVVPFVIFQHWLLGGFDPMILDGNDFFVNEWDWRLTVAFKCAVFVLFFAPLASVPTTLYLGQALFSEQPDARRMFQDWLRSLPQLCFLQLGIRSLLLSAIYFCLFNIDSPLGAMLVFLTLLTIILPFAVWPYLNEIIVLERNPFFSRKSKPNSTMRRAGALHRNSFGELLLRWLTSAAYAFLLSGLLFLAIWFTKLWTTGNLDLSRLNFLLLLEFSTWTTVCYFMVARFLCYLDLRIRREGWEVELKMRAEGARLAKQLS
ncbi:MAG: hypothetical protein N2C12_05130 [Planctomycetales bacterium]